MRINYIKLKNYRQYKDENINFPPFDERKNFVIIQGANDTGKTSLLNAITWCLYGKELHLEKGLKSLPIVNTVSLNELRSEESCEVEVEIQMRDEEDKKIVFKRTMIFRKSNGEVQPIPDLTSNEPDGSRFEIMRQIGKNIEPVAGPSYILQRLMPEKINEYFFFDGERLSEYFRQTAGEKIKDAVFKISQLELLDRMVDHLNEKKRDFLRTSKGLSPEAKGIREQLDLYQKSLEKYKGELGDLKLQRNESERIEREISEKLRASSVPNIKELEENRIDTEDDLNRLDERIDVLHKEIEDYLIDIAPSILACSAIIKTKEMIGGREEAGEIPPDYKKNFIEKLLKKGECICGTDISKRGMFRERVESLLKECDEISNISDTLIRTNSNLGSTLDELQKFPEKIIQFEKGTKRLEEERIEKSKKLKRISEKIASSDIEEVRRLEAKLQKYKDDIRGLSDEIGTMQAKIDLADKGIKELEKELKKEIEKEDKFEELKKIISFCDDSLEAAERTKNEIMKSTREEIEKITKKQFFELIWNKENYRDVKIDDNYNISVIHKSGRESIGSLGAGVRQALALSFIAALNSISGFNVPIVIDTPLGRISEEPRKNLANNLPDYLEGKQVIILATDTEYTPEVRKRLLKRVAKEYKISKKGEVASVLPYG